MTQDLAARFTRAFANIPLPERLNPIYVSQKFGPISWYVAKLEIDHGTEIGAEILSFLSRTEII